jgi:hypothetical protein
VVFFEIGVLFLKIGSLFFEGHLDAREKVLWRR